MQHGERRVACHTSGPPAERTGAAHVGLHHVGLEAPQQAANRPPAQRIPGAMATHPRALEIGTRIEGVHSIAFRPTDGEHLMPTRRDCPAQVDEHLLPAAQAARQHDLGDAHRLIAAPLRGRVRPARPCAEPEGLRVDQSELPSCLRPKVTHPVANPAKSRMYPGSLALWYREPGQPIKAYLLYVG